MALEGIITAAIGGFAGSITAISTPWARWGVKKAADDRKYRREQIEKWRAGIASLTLRDQIIRASWYPELRRHIEKFNPGLFYALEPPARVVVVSPIDQSPGLRMWVDDLMTVVDRVEDDWKLSVRKHRG